jgi:tRNA A-37 threonylcarbamoyl transferase component Bud32
MSPAPPTAAADVVVPPTARRSRRRRRPSGAPPPLPRSLGFTGRGWLVLLGVLIVWVVVTLWSRPARRITDRVDAAVLRAIARVRTDPLTDAMRAVDRVASGWTMSIVAALLTIALLVFRRWRHLFTFGASVMVLELLGVLLYEGFSRPRPYDVTIVGHWRGYSLPSAPIAVVTILAVAIVYTMIVHGHARNVAKVFAGVAVGSAVVARLYLGEDHPFDALVAVAAGVAIPLNAFRFFTPNEVFPVAYGGGKTAHLDVGGRRGEAIRRAVEDQLGVTVLDAQPVGLGGSGGSTPLRMRIAGDPDTYVFGKLYAMNHVRADRWYKLGRTILYGRLEDETPFQSVRRLVQYEDYALRVMRDAGIRTAAPLGIVELTPEREYLLVTEFFDGAVEISEAAVDETLIDEGLAVIRQLWDAGLAHRDIKPANLMVRDGHVFLIDVAFAQVRPSPWREAIDLANMMLVLAVRTDAELVYARALRYFTPDEIAEAFAAARGAASPTQLRAVMKQDGRDLLAQFRAMAPARRPISLQRWSVRRVALAAVVLLILVFSVQIYAELFTPADLPVSGRPDCGTSNLMILVAQSVPAAAELPCLAALPAGWQFESVEVREGETRFWLSSDLAGHHAVEVLLRPLDRCDTTEALEVPTDEAGTRRFERPEHLLPGLVSTRFYLFPGGCVTYRVDFDADAPASLIFTVDAAVGFQPREQLVDLVSRRTGGLRLCGADAAPCPGGDR